VATVALGLVEGDGGDVDRQRRYLVRVVRWFQRDPFHLLSKPF
jgi:hypothetical protein